MRAWRPSDLLALLRLKQPGGTLEPAPVVPVPAHPADAARAAPPSPSAG